MSDFVVNVRQISSYPPIPTITGTENLLLQQNGIGGPYYSSTVLDLLENGASNPDSTVGIGVTVPDDADGAGVLASNLVAQLGCTIGWNWYNNSAGGESYLATGGGAGVWCFDGQTLNFYFAPAGGTAGQVIPSWTVAMSLTWTGEMSLSDSLILGRDPLVPLEAVTLQYLQAQVAALTTLINNNRINSVTSFMSRTGAVVLTAPDIQFAGGALLNSPQFYGTPTAPTAPSGTSTTQLATTAFVVSTFNDWVAVTPIVSSFNGRSGVVTLNIGDITGAGGAPLLGPAFTGTPTAPTPALTANNTQIATTQFVQGLLAQKLEDVVQSFNGRIGAVVLQLADITGAGGAPIASPNFTGIPTGPTAAPGTSDSQLATTAFVMQNTADHIAGVASFNTRVGHVVLELQDIVDAGGAPVDSPWLVGVPSAPTAPFGTNSQQIATTAFVVGTFNNWAAVTPLVHSFNDRSGIVRLELSDVTGAGGAPIASPNFLGTPSAPTPPEFDNTTRLATTAFVKRAIDPLYDAINDTVLTFNGRRGHVVFQANDLSAVGGAFLNSPHFTGIPRAPQPLGGSNDDQIATTQWVNQRIAAASLVGPPGPAGPPGPPGEGYQILGTKPSHGDLPTTGNVRGDIWIVDGVGWSWNGTTWVPIGQLQGVAGPPGPQGEVGHSIVAKGTVPRREDLPDHDQVIGDFYVAEDTGIGYVWDGHDWVDVGPMRSQVPGPPGPQGERGTGIRFQGAVPTYADLPDHDQTDGDWYTTEDTGDGWVWENGRWVFAGQMRGPEGEPGPAGPPGGAPTVSPTPPATPITGELWFNSTTGQLMIWNGSAWVPTSTGAGGGGATVSPTPPASPATGDLWLNSTTDELSVWDGTTWVAVAGGPGGGAAVGPTPPSSPVTGDLWFNDATDELSVWDGTAWVAVSGGGGIPDAPADGTIYGREDGEWVPVPSGTSVGTTPPSDPQLGDLWWDGTVLWVWNGASWGLTTAGYLPLVGGTLTGILNANPTAPASSPAQINVGGQGISYSQLAGNGANIAFAVVGGGVYCYQNGVALNGPFMTEMGGTFTGPITLSGPATQPNEPITLDQLDSAIADTAPPVTTDVAPPSAPIDGQLWWDTVSAQLFIWDGAQWVVTVNQPSAGGTSVQPGPTPPTSPSDGDLWWDTVGAQLYIWDTAQWVIVVNPPGGVPAGNVTVTGDLSVGGNITTPLCIAAFTAPLPDLQPGEILADSGYVCDTVNGIGVNVYVDSAGVTRYRKSDTSSWSHSALAAGGINLGWWWMGSGNADDATPGGSLVMQLGSLGDLELGGSINCVWCQPVQGDNSGFVGSPGQAWNDMNSYAFTQQSDPKNKRDLAPAEPGALEEVLAVPVVNYRHIDDDVTAPLRTGFDVTDIEKANPDLCTHDKDGKPIGYSLSDIIAVLWQAVQELTAKVAELEAA